MFLVARGNAWSLLLMIALSSCLKICSNDTADAIIIVVVIEKMYTSPSYSDRKLKWLVKSNTK